MKLWRWFSINHRLYSGMMVVAGNPHIRIGTRLSNQREPSSFFNEREYERRTYYVEKVVHDYVDGSHFLTHVGVTRGQPLDEFITAKKAETVTSTALLKEAS